MLELLLTHRGRVAILALNRPAQGNRLAAPLAREITRTLESLRADRAIGACVLTGRGEVFCLGGDYAGAGPTAAGRAEYANALIAMDESMAQLGKPLIAAARRALLAALEAKDRE